MIIDNKKGIFFFITGISGSGKSTLAKKIKKIIQINYGKTIVFHGDEIRKIFHLNGYTLKERKKYALQYSKLSKKIVDEKINIILATVSMFSDIRRWNRKNIKNYVEIYIKSDLKKILKRKNKYFYKIKTNNVIGVNIKPELPTNPNIIIKNNFDKSIDSLGKDLVKKIMKVCLK